MLQIRKAQIEAFSDDAKARFENRMARQLRTGHPSRMRPLKKEELRLLIREETAKAAGYGITDEADVERYLDCVGEYGRGFDNGWAGPILRDSNLDGHEKMNRIDERRMFEAAGRMS